MSEHTRVILDDGTGRDFDKRLRGGDGVHTLQDGGDLAIVTKDDGTGAGRAIAMLTFTVEVDGKPVRAQTVVAMRNLLNAAAILYGRYDPDGWPLLRSSAAQGRA